MNTRQRRFIFHFQLMNIIWISKGKNSLSTKISNKIVRKFLQVNHSTKKIIEGMNGMIKMGGKTRPNLDNLVIVLIKNWILSNYFIIKGKKRKDKNKKKDC